MATRDLNQVVRLTQCLDVPGHTAKLVRVMTEAGNQQSYKLLR